MSQAEAGVSKRKRESPWEIAGIFALGFVLLALLLSSPMLFRAFLYQPFNIASGSMKPALLIGDYLFVSKYAYGYGRYTWPFSAPESGRIWGRVPARGDVIGFRMKDGKTDYIKRVIGLPGDRVQMKQGVVYINDEPVQRTLLADWFGPSPCGQRGNALARHWRETLSNGVSYETLECTNNGPYDNTNVYTVPPGDLFVLGDNRGNSLDSRMLADLGYIPIDEVIGRAAMIFFSAGGDRGERPGPHFDRIGTMVR